MTIYDNININIISHRCRKENYMKKKLIVVVLFISLFVYGCTKAKEAEPEVAQNESDIQEVVDYGQISENFDTATNENFTEEYLDNDELEVKFETKR